MNFSKKRIYLLSITVGIFHFIMPFLGNLIGINIINELPISADVLVGIIFIIIALQMIFQEEEVIEIKRFWSIIFFAFTVSIDSFSVGIGVSSWMGSDIFSNCTSLTTASVYVTEDTIESPPSLTGMFKGCSSLATVDLDSNYNNAFTLSNTTFTNTVNVNLTYHYWEESQKNGYPWGGTALNVTYDLNT